MSRPSDAKGPQGSRQNKPTARVSRERGSRSARPARTPASRNANAARRAPASQTPRRNVSSQAVQRQPRPRPSYDYDDFYDDSPARTRPSRSMHSSLDDEWEAMAPPEPKRTPYLAYVGATLVIVAIVAIGVGLISGNFAVLLPFSSDAAAYNAAGQAASAGEGEATDPGASNTYAPTAPAAPDPRDAEFAVDPARQDWNYESNGQKVIYLTMDDGPSANTAPVLDILDRYGIKATFFVTGQNPDYFNMIGEAYRRGHTIGLHTYSHNYDEVYASEESYYADLNAIASLVREQIGYVPCFIRFPGGSSNTICDQYCEGIMSVLRPGVQSLGYNYYDWIGSFGDGAEHTADELVGYACEYGDYHNLIMLLHDGEGHESTVEALPRVIEYYQSQGFQFAPIDRTSMVQQHVSVG
ncbi:MAG: polysaccharide deacetylase family protein [Coriobacteriales bacterium]|nr:polysaccharide deacetylase family protein [Coriobacteriales bacterium]